MDAKNKRMIIYGVLIAVLVFAIAGYIYTTYYYKITCENYECWKGYMEKCSTATFIDEEPEASWRYTINGLENKECAITVRLLQAKRGELGLEKLVGSEMTCYYPIGKAGYPQNDLSRCHGILKEELQGVIINKLHSYILENLGKFDESLSKI